MKSPGLGHNLILRLMYSPPPHPQLQPLDIRWNRKISGCICSQQAQLCLLPVQAADPAGRGENEPGFCFQQPQGQDRRPLPREDEGLRAGEGKELGKRCLLEKKDTGETKEKLFTAEGNQPWKKKRLPPHNTWLPLPRRRDPALNPLPALHGWGILLLPKAPSQQQGCESSLEQGKGRVPKAKGVGASGSSSFGQERGRGDPDPNPALG